MGVGETGETQLEGEAFKRELFKGITTLWDSGHPSILICDDLHWADPASTELLGRFQTIIADVLSRVNHR